MASLRDGLGGEELAESGLQAGGVSISPFIVGSLTATSFISGLNLYAVGSLVAGRLTDANGVLLPASVGATGAGSPGSFGAFVQAGVAGPLLAATGSIVFGRAFANSGFVVTITPQVSGTLYPFVSSGTTTYTVSGITFGAQSGLSYNWIAVGL